MVRDASPPTHTQEGGCQLPPEASVIGAWEPRAHTHPIIKTGKCSQRPQPVFQQPLGLEARSVEYSLRGLCHSALLRLALGGQPFSISNDVPQKSVSRATGVPNTLRGSFARRVFYLHSPVSLRGCRLIQTSRGGECERVVAGGGGRKKCISMMSESARRPRFVPARGKSADPSVSRPV